MASRNILPFAAITALLSIALMTGLSRNHPTAPKTLQEIAPAVPCIGSIQVLNGCGIAGAADRVTDYLRLKKFDVKYKGNAETWNYPFTMVISRTADMTIARQVAAALTTDRCVLMRNGDSTYNVTVIIGPDYEERIP
jgi:hypothetical protein